MTLMTLSSYGRREILIICLLSLALICGCVVLKLWWAIIPVAIFGLGLLAFFRDPKRVIPTREGILVSPADGVVSSVHDVDHYDLFDEPASCVRIFLSVLDVHVTRVRCAGKVGEITDKKGLFRNAQNPDSAEVNASKRFPIIDPNTGETIAAVRQVVGMIARQIVCGVEEGDSLERGERFGMMKFGSTAEVYVPKRFAPKVLVKQGERVWGGKTELIEISSGDDE